MLKCCRKGDGGLGYDFKRQRILKKFVAEKVVRPWPDRRLRSTQPCIPPGSFNRVPASAGVRAGMSPLPGGM